MKAQNASEKHGAPKSTSTLEKLMQKVCILKVATPICMVFLCSCQTVKHANSESNSESATVNIVIREF